MQVCRDDDGDSGHWFDDWGVIPGNVYFFVITFTFVLTLASTCERQSSHSSVKGGGREKLR
jgi:hypothetical protein